MKKAIFAAVALGAIFSAGSTAETRRYIETLGNASGERIVSIEEDAATGLVTVDSSVPKTGERDVVVSAADGSAVSWTSVAANGDTRVFSRKGNAIEIGAAGATRPAKGSLDEGPWLASMDFGLARFAAGGGRSMTFWIVNPQNGKAYKMDAKRMETKPLSVNGKEEDAVRVEVTAHGVPALFYSMSYWFRENDSLFLKFAGTRGGPGSPKYTLEFAGEK